ncbi:MAG: hypothetical protein AAB917_03315 [Patescibacteria group bacterium]
MREGKITTVQEISQKPEYLDVYLGVREEEDHEGVIIDQSLRELDVRVSIERDRQDRAPTQLYHLFKPGTLGQDRLGIVIGGEDNLEEIVIEDL